MGEKMQIGFALNRGNSGPQLFLQRLRRSMEIHGLAKTSLFCNPFNSVNLYANRKHRLPWAKPYFFRADGVCFDNQLSAEERAFRNKELVLGANGALGVIFQSRFARQMYKEILDVNPKNSVIVPNGTDLTLFAPGTPEEIRAQRARWNIPEESFVCLTSAAWRAHKRLPSVIRVFEQVQRALKQECYLVVIGEQRDTSLSSNSHILSLGRMQNAEMHRCLKAADVYLFFSWLDGCPNSVIEAMASGLPVVCTDQGGTRELVESANGGIVAEGADEPFPFQLTDLYHPPVPDEKLLTESVLKVHDDLAAYKKNIRREVLDIDLAAEKYVSFIKRIYYEKH